MKSYDSSDELSLIWLDSILGLEYKHKLEIYTYVKNSEKISKGLPFLKLINFGKSCVMETV